MPKGHYVRELDQNKSKYAKGTLHQTSQGELVVLERVDFTHSLVKFTDTGYVTKCRNTNIYNNKVKDHRLPSVYGVGFLDGIKIQPRGTEQRRLYDTWANMLRRCYHDKTGATVSKEWHSFRIFLNSAPDIPGWDLFIEGNPMHLDKDIRCPGNKVYSLKTCSFVTPYTNVKDSADRRWGNK